MNALIIRPGALGDTLMLLPSLTTLTDRATVTFVGREPGLDFIRPWVSCAMDMERSGWHRLFINRMGGEVLPVSKAEIAVAFFSDQDGVISNNLQSFLPDAAVHLFRSFPRKGKDVHVATYLAECLESAGLPVDPVGSIKAIQRGSLRKKIDLSGRRDKIVLHPGSGSSEKNYPPEFWSNLFEKFNNKTHFGNLKPVFLLGPAEESLYLYFKNRSQIIDNVHVITSYGKGSLIRTINEAALYVGHDSGVTHLFAMLGVRTVALFKKSNAIQWGPLGPNVTVIQEKKPDRALINGILEVSRAFLGMPGSSLPNELQS